MEKLKIISISNRLCAEYVKSYYLVDESWRDVDGDPLKIIESFKNLLNSHRQTNYYDLQFAIYDWAKGHYKYDIRFHLLHNLFMTDKEGKKIIKNLKHNLLTIEKLHYKKHESTNGTYSRSCEIVELIERLIDKPENIKLKNKIRFKFNCLIRRLENRFSKLYFDKESAEAYLYNFMQKEKPELGYCVENLKSINSSICYYSDRWCWERLYAVKYFMKNVLELI